MQLKKLPLIEAVDIYAIIAKKLKMSKEEVAGVFAVYAELHQNAIVHRQRLILPHIGQFILDYREGKKAGSKIRSFELSEDYKLNSKGAPIRDNVEKILLEDRPSYCRSVFIVNKKLQNDIKEKTIDIRSKGV